MNSHSTENENESISCLICDEDKKRSEIIELHCTHIFCWVCIQKYLQDNSDINVKCPKDFCYEFLTDSEKRKVLSEDEIEIYEKKCLTSLKNSHRCLLPQCGTIVFYTDPNTQYNCAMCNLYNCVACKAPHTEYKCKGFQSLSSQDKTSYCKEEISRAEKIYEKKRMKNVREDMLSIEHISIVNNDEIFECPICCLCIGKGDGVVLKNCGCRLCKPCLINAIKTSPTVPISCPMCSEENINEEEIQTILPPNLLSQYRDLCIKIAKSQLDSHFHCQAMDCGVLHHTKATTTSFTCAKCKALNCIKCKTVHTNETCDKYQEFIQEQIRHGIVWPCIICKTHLRKISGCSWIKCPSCKTELCWLNRMTRWGPGGRGDISGGCKCMVNGIPCHNDCKGTCLHDRWLQL